MMKYIFGLLALCFCLSLSVDVGAVEQPIKAEFVQAHEAPIVLCESIEVDFAIRPVFQEEIAPNYPDQPASRHGNLERSCISSYEINYYRYPSLQIEAPFIERYQNRTTDSVASVPAKENDDNCLSDFKVGWQA